MFSWPSEFIVHQFHKLGFCSVSFNATLALVGQLCKNLHRASLGSVSISALEIHTCWIQQHAILLLHLVFRSRTEGHQVSQNEIFMRLSTQHKSATKFRSMNHRLRWSPSMPLPRSQYKIYVEAMYLHYKK